MAEKIEVQVEDHQVTLWWRHQVIARLQITERGVAWLNVPHDSTAVHDNFLGPPGKSHQLEVTTLVKRKEEIVGLPRLIGGRIEDGQVFTPKRPRSGSSSSRGDGPLIGKELVDAIINEVCDSYIATPHQTLAFTQAESRRIANKFSVGVGSVAAVRANMTRGTYDHDVDTLIALRRSYLKRHGKLADEG